MKWLDVRPDQLPEQDEYVIVDCYEGVTYAVFSRTNGEPAWYGDAEGDVRHGVTRWQRFPPP